VVNRPGLDREALPPGPDVLGPDAHALRFVTVPPIGISSSDLRARRAEGRSIRFQVPRGVEAYIDAHGLYPCPTSSSPGQAEAL
jgi:nicotinate-nucleotide adenylyltransferase